VSTGGTIGGRRGEKALVKKEKTCQRRKGPKAKGAPAEDADPYMGAQHHLNDDVRKNGRSNPGTSKKAFFVRVEGAMNRARCKAGKEFPHEVEKDPEKRGRTRVKEDRSPVGPGVPRAILGDGQSKKEAGPKPRSNLDIWRDLSEKKKKGRGQDPCVLLKTHTGRDFRGCRQAVRGCRKGLNRRKIQRC